MPLADVFTTGVFVGLAAIFFAFIALVGLWVPRRTSDITDKKAQRAWGEMSRIEERDVPAMVEAQNRYRRRRGVSTRSESEVRSAVAEEQLDRLDSENARLHVERSGQATEEAGH